MAYFADNPNCPSNFLSGAGFQFSLKKLPGVSFYCQSANVPSQNLAVAMQATRFNTIPEPGDEVNYDDLTVRFLVDEDLKNYRSIHNWIRYLGHPESDQDWTTYADGDSYQEKQYSDGILFVLDSNFNRKFKIYFKDLFPVSLSGLNFDSTYTDTEYFAVDATFKFTIFDIEEVGATGFFTQADPPTVSISHTVDSNNNVILTWSSQNASYIIIDQGVGEASLFGTDTIPAANVSSRMSNGTLIYTITATGRGGTATAFTTVNIGVPVTNATIVNIAVIDESDSQSLTGMEIKWTNFRSNYPDRPFYLLQPAECTNYDILRAPLSFMEETDPATITNVCGQVEAAQADYFVVTYTFTDGRDLDTRTYTTSPDVGGPLGWARGSTIGSPAYVTWGGDNTGVGVESVLIDIPQLLVSHPNETEIALDLRAFWYGSVGTNPVVVNVTSYKGGAMVKSGFSWVNLTATNVYNTFTSSSRQITTSSTSQGQEGERIAVMTINFVQGNVTFA